MSSVPLTTNPPFGYGKNPNTTNEWIINEEATRAVKRIFNLCVEGYRPSQIAKELKSDKILTPTKYWTNIGRKYSKPPLGHTFLTKGVPREALYFAIAKGY